MKQVEVSAAGLRNSLSYPHENMLKLEGAAGTEFVFACGNRGRLPRPHEVRELLEACLHSEPLALPNDTMICLTRDRLEIMAGRTGETPRGHGIVPADDLCRAEDALNKLRQAFRARYDFFVGVAVPVVGK